MIWYPYAQMKTLDAPVKIEKAGWDEEIPEL